MLTDVSRITIYLIRHQTVKINESKCMAHQISDYLPSIENFKLY